MAKRKLAKAPSKKDQLQKKSHLTTWVVIGVLAVALAAMVAFMLYQSGGRDTTVRSAVARSGSTAPDFTMRLFSGKDITLSNLKGKPVLMNFWSSS